MAQGEDRAFWQGWGQRIIVGAIAFSQFCLSLLLLALGLYIPYLLPFGLWGLINSFTLLSANVAARKSALIWYIMFLAFVGYGTARAGHPPSDPTSRALEVWAFVALAAVLYLARILGYLGNRDN